jgi:hypothetical protein
MPNQIIVVETPAYETKTEYGTQITEATCSEEHGRFEALTRKLVQVPKSEIDEKRRESGS